MEWNHRQGVVRMQTADHRQEGTTRTIPDDPEVAQQSKTPMMMVEIAMRRTIPDCPDVARRSKTPMTMEQVAVAHRQQTTIAMIEVASKDHPLLYRQEASV